MRVEIDQEGLDAYKHRVKRQTMGAKLMREIAMMVEPRVQKDTPPEFIIIQVTSDERDLLNEVGAIQSNKIAVRIEDMDGDEKTILFEYRLDRTNVGEGLDL